MTRRAQDAFNGELTKQAVAATVAGVLLFYSAGAYLRPGRARLALGAGLVGLGLEVLIVAGGISDVLFEAAELVA